MSDTSGSPEGSWLRRFGHRLVHSRHALWGLTLASFLESTVVPIPLEALLIPLMQARRQQLFLLAALALLGCLLGASVGYGAGLWLFDAFGDQLLEWFANPEQFERARTAMADHGFWFVLSVGVTPVPFQTAMLVAGATGYSFALFMLASALGLLWLLWCWRLGFSCWFECGRAQPTRNGAQLNYKMTFVDPQQSEYGDE